MNKECCVCLGTGKAQGDKCPFCKGNGYTIEECNSIKIVSSRYLDVLSLGDGSKLI